MRRGDPNPGTIATWSVYRQFLTVRCGFKAFDGIRHVGYAFTKRGAQKLGTQWASEASQRWQEVQHG